MAQKKVSMGAEMRMIPHCHPECHPERPMLMVYVPSRGGDEIKIKCPECYRVFFTVKLPKERD